MEIYAKRKKMCWDIFTKKFLCRNEEHTKVWEYKCLSKLIFENRLYKFIQQFDKMITKIWHNEAKTEFEINNASFILSTKFIILEKHTISVFIMELFFKLCEKIKNAKLLFMVKIINNNTFWSYILSNFRHPNYKWEV